MPMTRPSCKICRRVKEKLFLKGERCHTAKCALDKRAQSGKQAKAAKLSEYGRRLREKQKLRFFYGVSEKQIRILFAEASRKKGVTGYNLLSLFERRLDNVVFRLNLAKSRKEARQLVGHGHFRVNGKKMDIASHVLSIGDVVSIASGSEQFLNVGLVKLKESGCPSWIAYNDSEKSAKIQQEPERQQIDVPVEEHLIVEYYAK